MANTLPNAPLVEVVLEIRWALLGEPRILSGPEDLRTDPGYAYLVEKFAVAAKKLGYTRRSVINTNQPIGPIGYSVPQRFGRYSNWLSHSDRGGFATVVLWRFRRSGACFQAPTKAPRVAQRSISFGC